MGNTLATMLTMTTYGTWLRGDKRGWVEDGVIYPPDPELQSADQSRMQHAPFRFEQSDLSRIGQSISDSLLQRLQQCIYALTVQTWHVHVVISTTTNPISAVVKCAKDVARYTLRPGRTIWTDGYDKRFCFEEQTVRNRIAYVERHNLERGWPAKPWPFIVPFG
ncbi:MAG TPA: hypothetical protein VFE46_20155 [Pirellulales bacterium]|jgi:hypothetical protein|nr:hypothetical protein [Pirellulales bacterium]